MSETRLISPLLDDFHIGEAISEHHGVRCFPAMPESSDDKYIVKTISIPASQVQLQALLLTGAFTSEAAAGEYFKELADSVVQEVQILERLSKLEGFLPYSGVQVAPMEKGVGSEVYLLSPYRPSLARYLRRTNMTHLAAINLGLDLCASLAVCRQSGYLYTDLKPENVFVCNDQEFRIGDIGFLKLDSLKYASIAERNISAYTAPEIRDAYSDLNTTMDTYAAGLILYQAYNGGELPFEGRAGEEPLAPPAYADYELAEIILKACAPDPKDRWQDPIAMGQALVAYMQRNGVNDTPIVTVPEERPEETFEPEEEITEEELVEEETVPDITDTVPLSLAEELAGAAEAVAAESEADDQAQEQICLDEFYNLLIEEDEITDDPQNIDLDVDLPAPVEADAPVSDPDADLLNLSFLDDLVADDTAPSEAMAEDIVYDELSADAFDILAQADDLLAHETPEGVVAPEPVEIPMPEPIVLEPEEAEPVSEETQDIAPTQVISEDLEPEETDEILPEPEDEDVFEQSKTVRNAKKWIAWIVVLLLLAGMAFGGYIFYKDYYIRTVSKLALTGSEDSLTVSVASNADDALLSVTCTDTYGTTKTAQVLNGQATFTKLNPNTLYTIKVQITGMHKLTGDLQTSYTTPVQTNIISFQAVTGNEPGSAILSFTVDGMDSETWSVIYTAPGVEEKKLIFSGHMANVTGLESGKVYTFRLEGAANLYITGQYELEYTAKDPVFAQDLAITAVTENTLTVSWNAPEGAQVSGWTVRCYSDSGFDKTVATTDTTLVFEGINGNEAHTVEVVADGMSAGTRCYMTDGAITVSNIRWESVGGVSMRLNWDFAGNAPACAWIITYQGDNGSFLEMARSETNSLVLSPLVPGSSYVISILLEDGTTIFSEPVVLTVPEAADFYANGLGRNNITAYMCRTPLDVEDWEEVDLEEDDYTDTFAPGERASFLLKSNHNYDPATTPIEIMYVIHDAEGKLVSCYVDQQIWRDMWYRRVCELDIPYMPEVVGEYTITVYFNGGFLHSQSFNIA